MPFDEAKKMNVKTDAPSDHYRKALDRSRRFREEYDRRHTIIRPRDMPWEQSPQGLIKHVINEELFTKEFALDMYIQVIEPGKGSGKHRHMAEEVFYVLEGRGYDLHWDVKPEISSKYAWKWKTQPMKLQWEEGDFVYIPPFTMHQHFNADLQSPARFITATNRLVGLLGLDWIDQVEQAPPQSKGVIP